MWVLLTSRIRRWVILSVAIPLLGLAARRVGQRMEKNRAPSRPSRALRRFGSLARRH